MTNDPRLTKLKECFSNGGNFIPQSGCSPQELQLQSTPHDLLESLDVRIAEWRNILVLVDRQGNFLSPHDISNLQINHKKGEL